MMISARTAFVALTVASLMGACSETTTTTYADTANRNVQIVNSTGFTITHFYGSNAGSNSWEEDILGVDVLPTGSAVNVNFNDASGYCTFDFKAEFSDGESVIQYGVNVCEISTFTFY